MRYLHNPDLVFWIGVFVIIFFYVGFLAMRFRYEDIDFAEHKILVIFYIGLLVGSIYVWRILLGLLFNQQIIHMLQGS